VTAPGPRVSRRAALTTVLAVLFLTFLDTTIVSVTLGNLEEDISAGVIPLQWVINAYSLVFASLMLIGGSLADRLGRKWVMLGGIVVFCAGSVMCAVAPGVSTVIGGRAVMGIGAAASEPGTLSVIRQLFPDRRERARALGVWSAVSGLALALGPVIGGLLVGLDGWRLVFWFNLALGVVLAVAVWIFVPDSKDPTPGRLDLPGFLLGTGGIFCVVFASISGEYRGYGTWWIIALFVVGGASLAAFVPVESRSRSPMLDPRYLKPPIVKVALFAAFAVYFGVFAIFFLTALYLDIALQFSGWQLAGMFAPMALAIVLGGLVAGPWVARLGSRQPMVAGCAVAAGGIALARIEITRLPLHGDVATPQFLILSFALALAGLGFGITVVPLTSAVLSHIPAQHSGVAASATNTARQLGAVVGVSALGAIVNAKLVHEVNTSPDIRDAAKLLGPQVKDSILKILETGGSAGSFTLNTIPGGFLQAFLDGTAVSLLAAVALVGLAGVVALLVREPEALDEESAVVPGRPRPRPHPAEPPQPAATDVGSAPPSTSSSGSA
jgi:EmrB/QacA subfamily drug resistance transporter